MSNLKTVVRGAYDIQKLRIQMGNRIVANFKTKLGQPPGKKEDTLDAEGQRILKDMRASYNKLTDGVKSFPRQTTFKGDEIISSYTELCLLDQYLDLEKSEFQHFRRLGNVLRDYPIYTNYLEGVKGVGPAMAGVIVSEINIAEAQYPSSLWAYAGLDVAPDGEGRTRQQHHLIEREYKDKDGKLATCMGITFNPFLKTKLVGVLAGGFLRSGPNMYSKIYDAYKHRLENHPNHMEKTKLHRHRMALRYMIKRFLVDLHREWRAMEGFDPTLEYHEAKLGHTHTSSSERNPMKASEPPSPRNPTGKSEPIKGKNPDGKSESMKERNPESRSEPCTARNPTAASESKRGSNPNFQSEP